MVNLIIWAFLLVVVPFFASCTSAGYVRGCYYTNWAQYREGKGKFLPENYQAGLCTHIFYAFAVMNPDFSIKPFEWNDESTPWAKGMYQRVIDLKKQQPDLKVILAFGGWTYSQANLGLISGLIASKENRQNFIRHTIAFVRKNNFDGFDLDYEYPGASDKANFAVFVREMRQAFDAEAISSKKPRLLLTAAVSAGFEKLDAGYDVPSLSKSLDLINVMAYDFHGAWEPKTGSNSPLFDRNGDRYSVTDAANYWANHGAPKEKIIIGFPTYGRGWKLSGSGSKGIGSPASGPSNALEFTKAPGVAAYYEMCDLLEKGAKRYFDDAQKTTYLIKDDQWFSYDDAASFQPKLDWLKQNHFGGAFIWALDYDDFSGTCRSSAGQKYPLLALIARNLGGNQAQPLQSNPPIKLRKPNHNRNNANGAHQNRGSFRCPSAGRFRDPVECGKFYSCDASLRAHSMRCPGNLHFNPVSSACDYPANVRC